MISGEPHDQLWSRLIWALAEVMAESIASPPAMGLRGQLQRLAAVLSPGLPGTAIVALDGDGEILAIGLDRLELLALPSNVDILSRLGKELASRLNQDAWQDLETTLLRGPDGAGIQVLPISDTA